MKTDRGNNFLLNATLNTVETLQDGDKVGILYNFIPTSQENFKHSYKSTVEKFKKGVPTERNKMGVSYLFKSLISLIDTLIKDLSEVIGGKMNKRMKKIYWMRYWIK